MRTVAGERYAIVQAGAVVFIGNRGQVMEALAELDGRGDVVKAVRGMKVGSLVRKKAKKAKR